MPAFISLTSMTPGLLTRRPFSGRIFRASVLALALLQTGLAHAQTIPSGDTVSGFPLNLSGANGANGDDGYVSNDPATPGGNGGTINVTNNGTIASPSALDPTVSLTSNGGNGGNGDGDEVPPATAGNGGTINLTNNGTIELGVSPSPAAIILTANGGIGGTSDDSSFTPTPGGIGGTINFTNNASLTGNFAPANVILVTANGGISGTTAEGSNSPTSDGGAGGTVNITLQSGSLTVPTAGTSTALAFGLNASANGGAGATGYNAETGALDILNYASGGGDGGAGGQTAVTLAGNVTVSAANATGIMLTAAGGAGGLGGSDFSDIDQDPGSGGDGGIGGVTWLTVSASGTVTTSAENTTGIMLQSLGGNGGNGGPDSGSALDTGGPGGNGSDVGDSAENPSVQFTNNGTLSATADYSPVVILQSVGGTGGNGSPYGDSQGGDAGNGGFVVGQNNGTISTNGLYNFGLFGQSIGGTGGNGGPGSGLNFGGGNGGNSGLAGSVTLGNSGMIATVGDGSVAVVAQSIGGGNATNAFANAQFNLDVVTSPNGGGSGGNSSSWFFGARGGMGGSGGNGGSVVLSQSGTITTDGALANGLFGQSVGGGGGNGGDASSYGLGFSVALGGGGGGGGDAGSVTLLPNSVPAGSISTTGLTSAAINLQSVGGAGGTGGNASASSLGFITDFSIAVGGSGGLGGDGGTVTATNTSTLTTQSIDSPGILAQSIGGGGGQAGQASSNAIAMTTGQFPGISFALALGGNGGKGGDGGDVTVTNQAAITTGDDQSYAISAYSVGGGGGLGANAAGSTLPLGVSTKVPSFTIAAAVGGSGGSGGRGGDVTVTNSAALSTSGLFADAILASSVGGGGGNGGIGAAATITGDSATILAAAISPSTTFGVRVGVGGSGGEGGNGGAVSVTSTSNIQTQFINSRGIAAQSIGGGGGNAAGATASGSFNGSVNVAVGGSGGAAGDGGTVIANNNGGATISTAADGSHGLIGQSIGGGGGNGGSAAAQVYTTGALIHQGIVEGFKTSVLNYFKQELQPYVPIQLNQANPFTLAVGVAVGGSGGASGDGGAVNANNEGQILTQGNVAYGMFGQSVGGGGGTGGAGATTGGKLVSANIGLGGSGGAGGSGGDLAMGNTQGSLISTQGSTAYGMFAQTIGGGGGLGGAASDDTNLSYALTLSIGGDGQTSGDGGDINLANGGTIQTAGVEAHAIVAQSIGGGGGVAFLNILPVASGGGANNSNDSPTLSLDLGGNGGAGGNGGDLSLTTTGAIQTSGNNAFGLFAQSIGGGGGFGAQGGTSRNFALTGSLGGSGGAAGEGGDIGLGFDTGWNGAQPTISTTGNGSTAVFLQSIGGGGGYTGNFTSSNPFGFNAVFNGSEGGGGNGGSVSVTNLTGSSITINTTGANAHGLYLQSLGGGGGAVSGAIGLTIPLAANGTARTGASGSGGTIQVNTVGTIYTLGAGSVGIYAQSGVQLTDGTIGSGGAAISIQHNGTIGGGSGSGAAIQLDGGADNTISLTGGEVYALSGTAILASSGNDVVVNSGRLIGNVDLGTGFNQLVNASGGTLRPGSSLNLGGSNFTNAGTLAIFDDGPGATTVNGSFTQTSTGQWQVYVDYAQGQADMLTVTGAVSLSGSIYPIIYGLPTTLPATGLPILPIISGSQITTSNLTFLNTLAFTYSLSMGTTANLQTSVNFAPAAVLNDANITPSLQAAAEGLQKAWAAGGNLGALQPEFLALASLTSVSAYEAVLANYATEGAAAQGAGVTIQATQLQSSLHSFPAFVGTTTKLTEEGGGYVRYTGTSTRHDQAGWNTGYDQTARTVQAGGQRPFASGWFGGAVFGYTNVDLDSDDRRFASQGRRYDLGAVVKRLVGERGLLAASLGYGYGDHDSIRWIDRAGQALALTSAAKFHNVSGRVRGAWHLDGDFWYLRPSLDLDLTSVMSPAHRETGDARYAMAFDRDQDSTFAVTPALELGVRADLGGAVARAYVSVGESLSADRGWSRDARLVAASPAAAPFVSRYDTDDSLTQLTVGLDLIARGRFEFKAEYRGQFGSGYEANTVSGRLAYRF